MKRYWIPALIFVFGVVLIVGARLLPWEQYPVLTNALASLKKDVDRLLLQFGTVGISPGFVIKSALYLIALIFVARKTRRTFRVYLLDRLTMDLGHKYALEAAAEYVIVIVGLGVGLELTGANLNSIAIFGGALGIGVGFGLQSIVNNFVSGLVLLF